MIALLAQLANPRLWASLAIAAVLAWTHWQAYDMGRAHVQSAWDADKLQTAQQTLRLIERRDRATQDLQDTADAQRRAKNARISTLDADLAAALRRLSDRPDRPAERTSDVPAPAPAEPGARCTGAELYRSDAEFLIREAARAERVVAALAECQAAYGRAREALR